MSNWMGPTSHHQPINHLKEDLPPDWESWKDYDGTINSHLPFASSFLCLSCIFFVFFCFFRLCLSPLLFIIWPICGLMAGIPALVIVKKSWLHWKFRANSSQMGCMWEIWSVSKWAPPRGVAQAKESAVGHLTESPICLREELGQFFELNLIEYPSVSGGAHGPVSMVLTQVWISNLGPSNVWVTLGLSCTTWYSAHPGYAWSLWTYLLKLVIESLARSSPIARASHWIKIWGHVMKVDEIHDKRFEFSTCRSHSKISHFGTAKCCPRGRYRGPGL